MFRFEIKNKGGNKMQVRKIVLPMVVLAAIMMFALVGCGGNSTPVATPTPTPQPTPAATPAPTAPPVEEIAPPVVDLDPEGSAFFSEGELYELFNELYALFDELYHDSWGLVYVMAEIETDEDFLVWADEFEELSDDIALANEGIMAVAEFVPDSDAEWFLLFAAGFELLRIAMVDLDAAIYLAYTGDYDALEDRITVVATSLLAAELLIWGDQE